MAKKSDNEIASKISVEDLWKEIKVWNKCSLENDWDVWGIEQFDWITG